MRQSDIHRYITVIGRYNFAFLTGTFLGGNKDNTVGASCTIDSCRGCILENGDRLHILGSQHTHVASGYTVYDYQGFIGGIKRGGSTNLQTRCRVGIGSRYGTDIETGYLTGYQFHHIIDCALVKTFAIDLDDGRTHFFLGQGTITDNHYFFQFLCCFDQHDLHVIRGRQYLFTVTHERKLQQSILSTVDFEVSVEIRYRAVCGALHLYGGTDHRFTVHIDNGSMNNVCEQTQSAYAHDHY